MTTAAAFAGSKLEAATGIRSRVAGTGQPYEVVGMVDEATALIKVPSWDAPLPYAIADVELDLAGTCTRERFLRLVGQYRSMGPDGPEYEVVSIEGPTKAKIWVVGDEENKDYEIQDILIDPIVHNGT